MLHALCAEWKMAGVLGAFLSARVRVQHGDGGCGDARWHKGLLLLVTARYCQLDGWLSGRMELVAACIFCFALTDSRA